MSRLEESGRWRGIVKSLGPGLLMAGAAIGGSHLVQSTRGGADYGFALVAPLIDSFWQRAHLSQ